ncbi:MAG: glycosyltransferase family 2 protein, partial [Pararhizobium sp.]
SIARSLAVMQRFPTVGLVYGHPLHFADGERPQHRSTAASWTIWPGRDWLAARCRNGYNVITSPEVLMRRSVVDDVGGQMPLAHTHDMEMWLRLAAFSDVAYIHGADQAWHREHPQSLSARKVDTFRDLVERTKAFDTLFHGRAGRMPQAASLHEAAKAALAAQAVEAAIRRYDHGIPDAGDVEALRDLARSLVADTEAVPGWSGLERRIAMGAARARLHPPYLAQRILRRMRSRYSWWKWHRTGEW